MYAQMVKTGMPRGSKAAMIWTRRARFPASGSTRSEDRAKGMDARRLSQDGSSARSASTPIPRSSASFPKATGSPVRRRWSASRSCSPRFRTRRAWSLPLLRRRDAGVSRDALYEQLHSGKATYSSIFNYPTLSWADIGAIGWLVDGAAIMNQVPLQRCSYGPYSRAMIRICKEESFQSTAGLRHPDQDDEGHACPEGHGAGRTEPLVVAVADDVRPSDDGLGPPRPVDGLEDQAELQRRTQTEIRRPDGTTGRISRTDHPDPDLKWNEEKGGYDFGEPDWNEFFRG